MSNSNNNFSSTSGLLGGIAAVIAAIGGLIGAWRKPNTTPEPPHVVPPVQTEVKEQINVSGDSSKTVNQVGGNVNNQTIHQSIVFINPDVSTDESGTFEPSTSAPSQAKVQVFLVAQDSDSQINVRRGPGKNYGIQHYGLVDDQVTPLQWDTDSKGQTWIEVEFKSGATGWIREDFLAVYQS